jgi:hypothetical protein
VGLHLQFEDIDQEAFHLRDGVGPQHVDGHPAPFRVHDQLGTAAIVILQRHNRLGAAHVVSDDDRDAQAAGSLLQPVARHAVSVDPQRLESTRA